MILIFNLKKLKKKQINIGSRKTSTRIIPPDISHPENLPQRKLPPKITPNRTISTQDSSTRKIPTHDNFYAKKSPSRISCTRKIPAWKTSTLDNSNLKNSQMENLYLDYFNPDNSISYSSHPNNIQPGKTIPTRYFRQLDSPLNSE